MTACPQCKRTFSNPKLKYCTEDGTTLIAIEEGVSADSIAGTSPAGGHHSPLMTDAFFPPPVDPLGEGSTVGEYVVGKKIGEGGMGVIYAGVHPIIGKKVALKVLHREMASSPDIVQRFILEAKSVNQIGHRNIVDIFSFGKLSDGRQYFAMEFLDGESLSSRLAREEPMSWSDAIQLWIQVASAIEAAHGQGIVHRDLKPDNVFVTPTPDGPFVKVLDFGIAKLLGDLPTGLQKTSTGVPIGTPAYMSPEQARGLGVDNRTDLYAFGIILYETITGRPPFLHHNSFVTLLTAHLSEPPPPMAQFIDVHPELNALVEKLLAKEPADRPPDMHAVREELMRLRDLAVQLRLPLFAPRGEMAKLAAAVGEDSKTVERFAVVPRVEAPPSSQPTSPSLPAPRAGQTKLYVAAVVVVALGVGIVGAIGAGRHSAPPPSPAALDKPAAAVVEPPKPTAPSASALPPNTGRVAVTTNAPKNKVYLDKSETEHSAEPAAAGGMNLRVLVPAGINWILRVEADGFKPATMPLKIEAGEDTSLPVVLVPVGDVSKPHHGGTAARTGRPSTPGAPQSAAGEKKPTTNSNIMNPFD